MDLRHELHKRLKHIGPPLLGLGLVAYFGFHAISGDRGLIAHWRLNAEIESARDRLAAIRTERKRLEHRVRLLSPSSLDPDMLDERARAMLNLAGPNEVIVMLRPAGAE